MAQNRDIAKKVTDRMLAVIAQEKSLPWIKPWGADVNTITIKDGEKTITINPTAWNRRGKQYKGANAYLPVGEYITFAQAKAEGGKVRKGAHPWPVVYWNFFKKEVEETDEDGNVTKVTKRIPFLKYYNVFNVRDVEGLEQKHHPAPKTITVPVYKTKKVKNGSDLNADAEQVIADYLAQAGKGLKVKRDVATDEAFYSPFFDKVEVPTREQFRTVSEYYSTLFHELGHSTGHSTRLNRLDGSIKRFGDEAYSREELVAETTSASILSMLGLEDGNTFRNSSAYVKSWSNAIANDPMMYVVSMTKAQMAVDMILGISDDSTGEEDAE